jgi:ABC-type branched-subunit amino acid transport system substrate-binding protein
MRETTSVGATGLGRFLVARLMIAMLAVALLPEAARAQATPNHLRLGQLTELTGGGSAVGLAAKIGVALAVKEINASGGILGRQVDLVVADDQTDPTAAVNEARRLVDIEKIEGLLGPQLSQFVIATVPILTAAKILQISTGGSLKLTPEFGPYHFAQIADAGTQGIGMVDFAADEMKVKKVAFLGDNGANSKDAAQYVFQRIAERHLELTGKQEFGYRSEDVTPQLLDLRRGDPQALLYNTVSPEDLATFLRNREDIGWNVPVVGGQSAATFASSAAKTVGVDAFKGVTGRANIGLTYCTNDPVGQSPYAQYLTRLKPFAPDVYGRFSPATSSDMYDLVYIFKAAVEGAGTVDGPKAAAWLEANGSKLVSLQGPLSPSKTTHFLLGVASNVSVDRPYELREDGLLKRVGC